MNSEINKLSPLGSEKIASYLDKNGSILEIGSGKGETLRCLLEQGFTVTGVDKDAAEADAEVGGAEAAYAGIAQKTDAGIQKLPIIRARAEELPFCDGSFDQVLLECVFSLCAPIETVAEISRVLKPEGKVILTDLYSSAGCEIIETNALVRNLFTKEKLSELFAEYTLEYFEDASDALTDFAANLLFNGSPGCCGDIKELIKHKPKYGIWIYRKNRQ